MQRSEGKRRHDGNKFIVFRELKEKEGVWGVGWRGEVRKNGRARLNLLSNGVMGGFLLAVMQSELYY